MKCKLHSLAWVAFTAGMLAILGSGCSGTPEQSESPDPPKPKTVQIEKTVEVEKTIKVKSKPEPEPNSEQTAEPTTDEDQREPDEMTCEIGQECDLGESSVTVTNAEQADSISSFGETLEGDYVIVEFDYTYGGNTPVDLDEPPFQLSDGDGNTYSLDFDATDSYGIEEDRSLIYETVQPGVTAPGTAVFEVSPSASDFTLFVVDLVSPQANEAAMIPLPDSAQASSSSVQDSKTSSVDSALDSFVSSYYEAVGRKDWSGTYSMLDPQSQSVFTEDEWIQKQTARDANTSTSTLTSSVVNDVSGQEPELLANVTLAYDNGSQETLDVPIRLEDAEYKRYLTDDDIAYLETL